MFPCFYVSSSSSSSSSSFSSSSSPAARNDKNKSHISVLYINARSLIFKRKELSAYVATEEPDVVPITETWTNSTHLVFELSLPGYEIFQKNRTNIKGGGVICYVRSMLAVIKIYDSVYVEMTHNNKKLILATVYESPKLQAAYDTALCNEIQSLMQGKNAIVIGDFNCANVDKRLLIGDQEGSRFINVVEHSFLKQVIT